MQPGSTLDSCRLFYGLSFHEIRQLCGEKMQARRKAVLHNPSLKGDLASAYASHRNLKTLYNPSSSVAMVQPQFSPDPTRYLPPSSLHPRNSERKRGYTITFLGSYALGQHRLMHEDIDLNSNHLIICLSKYTPILSVYFQEKAHIRRCSIRYRHTTINDSAISGFYIATLQLASI